MRIKQFKFGIDTLDALIIHDIGLGTFRLNEFLRNVSYVGIDFTASVVERRSTQYDSFHPPWILGMALLRYEDQKSDSELHQVDCFAITDERSGQRLNHFLSQNQVVDLKYSSVIIPPGYADDFSASKEDILAGITLVVYKVEQEGPPKLTEKLECNAESHDKRSSSLKPEEDVEVSERGGILELD